MLPAHVVRWPYLCVSHVTLLSRGEGGEGGFSLFLVNGVCGGEWDCPALSSWTILSVSWSGTVCLPFAREQYLWAGVGLSCFVLVNNIFEPEWDCLPAFSSWTISLSWSGTVCLSFPREWYLWAGVGLSACLFLVNDICELEWDCLPAFSSWMISVSWSGTVCLPFPREWYLWAGVGLGLAACLFLVNDICELEWDWDCLPAFSSWMISVSWSGTGTGCLPFPREWYLWAGVGLGLAACLFLVNDICELEWDCLPAFSSWMISVSWSGTVCLPFPREWYLWAGVGLSTRSHSVVDKKRRGKQEPTARTPAIGKLLDKQKLLVIVVIVVTTVVMIVIIKMKW